MVRYFYALIPPVVVAAVVLLSLPWLGLIALMVFALAALGTVAALTSVMVFVPYMLALAAGRRLHMRGGASPQTAAALSLAKRQDR
jgi:hypothetical protein